jgi:putative hydrolase of HD superfamily
LNQQISFVLEIDKLKNVLRQSYVVGTDQRENSAEHSWHVATMAIILAEYTSEPVDLSRVLKMLLIHDIIEIDAEDTFCYDETGNLDKTERECQAADRLFGLLPEDQAAELRELWDEFEARATPESKFAATLDRVMPLLHNYYAKGKTWQEHGVTSDQVIARNASIRDTSEVLWQFARSIIEDAVNKGYLAASNSEPDERP